MATSYGSNQDAAKSWNPPTIVKLTDFLPSRETRQWRRTKKLDDLSLDTLKDIRDGDQRICLYRLNSPRSARHYLDEGVRLPLGRGAAGRVLLVFTERGDASLQAIRDAGLVISRGERDPEIAAVSAPVIDSTGHLRGALSLSTLMSRFDTAAERKLVEAIVPAAKQLAACLPAE